MCVIKSEHAYTTKRTQIQFDSQRGNTGESVWGKGYIFRPYTLEPYRIPLFAPYPLQFVYRLSEMG